MSVPSTLPPGPAKVKVGLLMVAGFMSLLKVALIMAVLGQTPTLPLSGVTRTTVGGVAGDEAATPFLSGSPHPAVKMSNRSAANQILWILYIRIHTSSSRLNCRRILFPQLTVATLDSGVCPKRDTQ